MVSTYVFRYSRMNEGKSYYSVLGCEENASVDVIRRCYHKKALLHHPDKGTNNGKVEDMPGFDVISKAWKTLSDPEARRVYDAELSESRLARQELVFGRFSLSDLTLDRDDNTYKQSCRCGGMFVLASEDLALAEDCDISVECDTCSLVIHVHQT